MEFKTTIGAITNIAKNVENAEELRSVLETLGVNAFEIQKARADMAYIYSTKKGFVGTVTGEQEKLIRLLADS